MADTVFQHMPLRDPGNEIRLLRIQPGKGIQPIRCAMSVHPLHEPGLRYNAISYTWGSAFDRRDIWIDGLRFSVTRNCWYALYQMRLHHGSFLHWIDAICIDQTDDDERGHQVRAMGWIYAGAIGTSACIGDDGRLQVIHDFDQPRYKLLKFYANSLDPDQAVCTYIAAFMSLSELQYWKRLWIVQELFLARQIDVYCGEDRIPWSTLSGIYLRHAEIARSEQSKRDAHEQHAELTGSKPSTQDIHQQFKSTELYRLLVEVADRLHRPRAALHMQRRGTSNYAARACMQNGRLVSDNAINVPPIRSLYQTFMAYSSNACQRPHDKVYGLLALVCEDVRFKDYPVNYDQSIVEVLKDFVSYSHEPDKVLRSLPCVAQRLGITPAALGRASYISWGFQEWNVTPAYYAYLCCDHVYRGERRKGLSTPLCDVLLGLVQVRLIHENRCRDIKACVRKDWQLGFLTDCDPEDFDLLTPLHAVYLTRDRLCIVSRLNDPVAKVMGVSATTFGKADVCHHSDCKNLASRLVTVLVPHNLEDSTATPLPTSSPGIRACSGSLFPPGVLTPYDPHSGAFQGNRASSDTDLIDKSEFAALPYMEEDVLDQLRITRDASFDSESLGNTTYFCVQPASMRDMLVESEPPLNSLFLDPDSAEHISVGDMGYVDIGDIGELVRALQRGCTCR